MKVIKVVGVIEGGKLTSTFASLEWQKAYAEGVETKPDTGYLFAYSIKSLKVAKRDFGSHDLYQCWQAEAEVVSRVKDWEISVREDRWSDFWRYLKLPPRKRKAEYLLCSSITLIKRLV